MSHESDLNTCYLATTALSIHPKLKKNSLFFFSFLPPSAVSKSFFFLPDSTILQSSAAPQGIPLIGVSEPSPLLPLNLPKCTSLTQTCRCKSSAGEDLCVPLYKKCGWRFFLFLSFFLNFGAGEVFKFFLKKFVFLFFPLYKFRKKEKGDVESFSLHKHYFSEWLSGQFTCIESMCWSPQIPLWCSATESFTSEGHLVHSSHVQRK